MVTGMRSLNHRLAEIISSSPHGRPNHQQGFQPESGQKSLFWSGFWFHQNHSWLLHYPRVAKQIFVTWSGFQYQGVCYLIRAARRVCKSPDCNYQKSVFGGPANCDHHSNDQARMIIDIFSLTSFLLAHAIFRSIPYASTSSGWKLDSIFGDMIICT